MHAILTEVLVVYRYALDGTDSKTGFQFVRLPRTNISQLALILAVLGCGTSVAAELCPVATLERVCSRANEVESSVVLDCSLDFRERNCADLDLPNHLTKKLIFEGNDASGLLIDLTGAHLDGGKAQFNYQRGDMIEIRSVKSEDGSWTVPTDINIQHARVTGSIRLYGMGRNGEAAAIREASHKSDGHLSIRRAAPKRITLDSLWVEGTGRNPIYFGPGVMHSTLKNSTVTGISTRVGVYLDAESAHNILTGNVFSVNTVDGSWLGFYDRGWPQLALDGSAHNEISNNSFEQLKQGGIYLYRNCGEGGTVRVETPSYNRITNNRFIYQRQRLSDPAIFIGSRNYGRFENWWPGSHCNDDVSGAAMGSAINNADNAQHNKISNNLFDLSKIGRQSVEFEEISIKQLIRIGNAQRDHSNEINDNQIEQ